MKTKKIFTLVVAIIVALSAISFASCSKVIDLDNNFTLSFSEAYDYSTLSAVGILSSCNGANESVSTLSCEGEGSGSIQENVSSGSIQEPILSDALSSELKQSILDNLTIVQNSISNGITKSEVSESDIEGYAYTYTIVATNELGQELTYVFYYNETIAEDEGEEEIHMDGIVILNEIEYKVVGDREIEEGEEEVSFKIELDENNYVIISQEIEEDEKEYKYMVFEDGKKILDTKIEYEYDEEENSIEMVFKTKTSTDEAQYKYNFFEDSTGSYIGVRIKSSTSNLKVLIQVVQNELGEFEYNFVKVSEDKKGQDKDLTKDYENVQDYDDDENESDDTDED